MKLKTWSIYILGFILPVLSSGQVPIWKDITLEEETNIFDVETDTIGFLWALSEEGLYKYNGINLDKKLSPSEPSHLFKSICIDQEHNILIGRKDGIILHFNPYTENLQETNLLKDNSSISFMDCKSVDKECLISSYGNGVHWRSTDLDTFLTVDDLLISNEVYEVILSAEKAILATDQGIQIIRKNTDGLSSQVINKESGLGDIIITHILVKDGYYWASNFDSQVYKIDTSTLLIETYDLPFKSKINGLLFTQSTTLTVYSDHGIHSLVDGVWIEKHPENKDLEVFDMTLDEENNLWMCNNTNMLSKANLGFHWFPNQIAKPLAILKVGDEFWLGSSEGLFVTEKNTTGKILDQNITSLQKYNGYILVGTFSSGIYVLDQNGNERGHIDGWENNPNQSVLYLYPTKDHLYVSSLTGVVRMTLSKNNGRYTAGYIVSLNSQLGPGYVYQILEKDEDLYCATDRQGLKIIRKDSVQHFTQFENGSKLSSVFSMTQCAAGNIWFASSTGQVGFIQEGEAHNIENERFLQDPYTSLIATPNKKIIMVRNSSIDVFDLPSRHFTYYKDIIPSDEQELFLNSYSIENEDIWLAKPNGVIELGLFDNQKLAPEPIINKVKANLLDAGYESSFSDDQNNLEFKFSSVWLTDPEYVTYQYKLDGLEDQWRTTRDQSALYPMLRPGNYNFRVKSSIDGQFNSNIEKSYAFTIHQSYYKTWWFILLSLLLIYVIFMKWRHERKKVKQQKEELNKKRIEAQLISLQTQLNPHFLFNSFNTLIGLIEQDPGKGITFTEKLTDFYRDILELGKKDLILLKDEIQLLDNYIHLLKERFGEQLDIRINVNDVVNYSIPPLTLQLLIENAVKHNVVSTKHPLEISVTQGDSTILVKNQIVPKYGVTKGTGLGLENIIKRHSLNNLRPPEIDKTETEFNVTIFLNKIEK